MKVCVWVGCHYPARGQDVPIGTLCLAHYNGGPGNDYGKAAVLPPSVLTPAPRRLMPLSSLHSYRADIASVYGVPVSVAIEYDRVRWVWRAIYNGEARWKLA